MLTCFESGWGSGGYGDGPWGGGSPFTAGGPLPFNEEFNIYCIGACGEMALFTTFEGTEEVVSSGQLSNDPETFDLLMLSGGSVSDDTAHIFVDTAVPLQWTLEFTIKITDLPNDFLDLTARHVFVGAADQQGACAGLFFSLLGIAYTGSVFFDGSNNLHPNNVVQLLPNSLNLVQEDVFYTIRIAVDGSLNQTFIYITETTQVPVIGHQLRYIMPAISSSACVYAPEDGTIISARGSVSAPSAIELNTICLGQGLLIPNLPPVADAGDDQAVRACSIVRFDGRRSFDPEGANLLYRWRLVDGPDSSHFIFIGSDGHTHGVGLSNRFYSDELEDYKNGATTDITAGDVLLVDGVTYNITATGTDLTYGFYVQIDEFSLPVNLLSVSFKLLKQNGISAPTSAQPTFYPDVSGLYKFDLIVFDGGLYSPVSSVVINVSESPVPRGIIPDLSFLWDYLSDVWKLPDDDIDIAVFWSAVAQVAASELLTLWQHDSAKSLRDIQRSFQRRWLHYDLFIQEPLIEQTTVEKNYAGIESLDLPIGGVANLGGKELFITTSTAGNGSIFFQGTGTISIATIEKQLRAQLQSISPDFSVTVRTSSDGLLCRILIFAPFSFTITTDSTVTTLYTLPSINDVPRGTVGASVGVNTYIVEKRLDLAGVRENDYLVVGKIAYRIARVVHDPIDSWGYQRIVTHDNMPTAPGSVWTILRGTRSKYIDFYGALCSDGDTAIYEIVDRATNSLAYIPANTLSAAVDGSSVLLTEQWPIAPYLDASDRYAVYFHSIYRRTYLPIDPLVLEVPRLQEKIRNTDDTEVLRQNIDYYREEFRGQSCLRFVTTSNSSLDVWQGDVSPVRMWAEITYIDNRPTIESNFGLPSEFRLDDLESLPSNVDYLSVVRGLWYTYFNGPTLYNLRAGTQILLGLPFAEEAGTILEVRSDFSSTQGRILVQDQNEQAIVRSYTYPNVLSLELNPDTGMIYKVGDVVKQFAPFVRGVEVLDYVKDPKWYEGYLNQGVFYEIEKFFKFLVRIDSAAFSLDTLVFVQSFILRIKPTYTYPLFVVLKEIGDTTVSTTDEVEYAGAYFIEDGVCSSPYAARWNFDHRDNIVFDGNYPDVPAPTYPTADTPVAWGYDRMYLCPEDVIIGMVCVEFLVPTYASFDSIFSFDSAVYTDAAVFGESGIEVIPGTGAPMEIGSTITMTGAFTFNAMQFEYQSTVVEPSAHALRIELLVNDIVVQTNDFTIPADLNQYSTPLPVSPSVPVATGDTVKVRLSTQNASPISTTSWGTATVTVGAAYNWAYDTQVPPGEYCSYKQM